MDPTPDNLRVLLVGEDPLARGALRSLFVSDPDVRIVAELGFDESLAPALLQADAEALLWDVGVGSDELVLPVRAPVPFVALVSDADEAKQVLRRGASGVLLRDGDADRMAGALRAAMEGLVAIDDRLSEALWMGAEEPVPLAEPLTTRESEVLRWLAEGLSNRQIASRLEISEHTVKFHCASVMAKLDASTRTEAVVRAARAGLLSL